MKLRSFIKASLAAALTITAFVAGSASAETYNIDPSHTFPSFEADHMGLSYWRGKFSKTSGTVELDLAQKTGSVDIKIDANSIDFGFEKMSNHAKSKDMFNVEANPIITYKGPIKFNGDKPSTVEGNLTLLGVTKPVTLTFNKFACITVPFAKCGADLSASFNRTDFGLNFGVPKFAPEVKLQIQVEAAKAN